VKLYVHSFLLFTSLLVVTSLAQGQCAPVINEILINGPGACDGACNPATEEWLEIFNPCTVAVDMSCWVLGDGDFTITFPQGTIIQPGAFFVVGSANSGPVVNLNLSTCGCTSGSLIGTFTNSSEQVMLFSGSGILQDAVYWGAGQFPATVNSPNLFGCAPVSTTFNAPGIGFEVLPGGGGNGCTLARVCDGAVQWTERCGGSVTMGASNGVPAVPAFSASSNTLCPGECIDFSYTGTGNPGAYVWQFPGSNTFESFQAAPGSVCYNSPGDFAVSLTVASACGPASVSVNAFISVEDLAVPVISPSGPVELCNGETEVISSNISGNLQWYVNGEPIPGANTITLDVSEAGSYQIQLNGVNCSALSDPVEVFAGELAPPVISPSGPVQVCGTDPVLLSAPDSYESYAWYFNGEPIPGAMASSWQAVESGVYSLEVANGSCSGFSQEVVVTFVPQPQVSWTPAGGEVICEDESIQLQATTGFDSYLLLINGLPANFIEGGTAVITSAGSYQVQVDVQGCTAQSEPFVLQTDASPEVVLLSDPSEVSCNGTPVQLGITTDPAHEISWFYNGGAIAGPNGPVLEASESGEYEVIVTNATGCVTALSVDVAIGNSSPVQIVTVDGTFTFCEGEALLLGATGEWGSLQWAFNGQFISDDPITLAAQSGSYSVQVLDALGCVFTDVVDVEELPSLTPVITPGGPVFLCPGETVLLQSSLPVTAWLLNGIPLPSSSTPQWQASQSGNYSVVTLPAPCLSPSNVVQVSSASLPDPTIAVSDQTPCQGESVTLSVTGSFQSVQWSTGVSGQNAVQVSQSDTYSVIVESADGCSAEDEALVTFTAVPVVSAGADQYNNCGAGVTLQGQVTGGAATWSPADFLSDPGVLQPTANPPAGITYTLTAVNGPCSASDQVEIISDCSFLIVPNVFTPNRDGDNDTFEVVAGGIRDFELRIYNRNGSLLFESKDPAERWHGEFNGSTVPEGTYYYTLRAVDLGGNDLTGGKQEGHITLLR